MTMSPIRVAIIEDDGEIRRLLTFIIDSSPGYECKQAFGDCESAIDRLVKEPPDVVLMDIELPGMSGIEGVRRLKDRIPETEFTMLTIRENDESVFDSICAGATGYLMKDTPPAALLEAIRELYDGGSPMTASIARRVVRSFRKPSHSPLTGRETEILLKLSDGCDYKAIAGQLFISGDTVRAHIKNIYKKLHVHSRGEAVKKAIQDRLI
jgi:DNA-binding NarL/FixJ family response regulator